MEISVLVCDVCQDRDRPTTRYTVATPDGAAGSTDRCDEHGAEFARVIGSVPVVLDDPTPAIARHHPGRKRVTTISAIEAGKAAQKRR